MSGPHSADIVLSTIAVLIDDNEGMSMGVTLTIGGTTLSGEKAPTDALHLADVRVLVGKALVSHVGAGALWRVRLASVDAYSFVLMPSLAELAGSSDQR